MTELPWPQKGDKAFREGRACHMRVGYSIDSISIIADGFKKASDILVEYLQQHYRDDSLVPPVLFGYRQCLELRIKALTATKNALEIGKPNFKKGHDLKILWNGIKTYLYEQAEQDDLEALQVVEQVIMEFHYRDEIGDGFRYPDELKQFHIDLLNMREVMDRVSIFLGSFNDSLRKKLSKNI
uniref:hypothetical protein n=1 Tax=Candidatus Electronema sp. TaxID=2698783 RepID=UPI004056523E